MIRLATRGDLVSIANLMEKELWESAYVLYIDKVDIMHIRKVVMNMLQFGYIWVYEHENEIVGMLSAHVEPNVWIPENKVFKETSWYVLPEYRKSVAAGKLFIKFCQKGEELIDKGEITGMLITRMATTDDIRLESRGFKLLEKLYGKG